MHSTHRHNWFYRPSLVKRPEQGLHMFYKGGLAQLPVTLHMLVPCLLVWSSEKLQDDYAISAHENTDIKM
jgi:hypothetical protein